jgi:hypothetical protein
MEIGTSDDAAGKEVGTILGHHLHLTIITNTNTN